MIDGRADQYALAATAYQLLTGSPPFQHSNPAVVISQHLTAKPPPIGSRRPELSSLGAVFDKALAKAPADRYARCIDFARALAIASAPGTLRDDSEATMARDHRTTRPKACEAAHQVASQGRDRRSGRARRARGRSGGLHRVRPAPRPSPAAAKSPPSAMSSSMPSARLATGRAGRRHACRWLWSGRTARRWAAAGITATGGPRTAHTCRRPMPPIWSLYPGEISSPTVTPGPDEEVYAPETESPVLVCMEQTGQSRLDCHDDILQSKRRSADRRARPHVCVGRLVTDLVKHPAVALATGTAAVAADGVLTAYRTAERLPVVGGWLRRTRAELTTRGEQVIAHGIDPATVLVSAVAARVVSLVLDELDLTALVRERVDVDAIAADIDIDAIVARIDLVGLANEVIDGVDLPAIIRESTSSVTADVMTDVRTQGERADDFVAGLVDRVLGRGQEPR